MPQPAERAPLASLLSDAALVVPLALPFGVAAGWAWQGVGLPYAWALCLHPLAVGLSLGVLSALTPAPTGKRRAPRLGLPRLALCGLSWGVMAAAVTLLTQPWSDLNVWRLALPFACAGALAALLLALTFVLELRAGRGPFAELEPAGPPFVSLAMLIGGACGGPVVGTLGFGLLCWTAERLEQLPGSETTPALSVTLFTALVWSAFGCLAAKLSETGGDRSP